MSEDLVYVCEICQTELDEHHCKAVCPNCGRMFDCSDLPLIRANGKRQDEKWIPTPGSDTQDPRFIVGNEGRDIPGANDWTEAEVADLP